MNEIIKCVIAILIGSGTTYLLIQPSFTMQDVRANIKDAIMEQKLNDDIEKSESLMRNRMDEIVARELRENAGEIIEDGGGGSGYI